MAGQAGPPGRRGGTGPEGRRFPPGRPRGPGGGGRAGRGRGRGRGLAAGAAGPGGGGGERHRRGEGEGAGSSSELGDRLRWWWKGLVLGAGGLAAAELRAEPAGTPDDLALLRSFGPGFRRGAFERALARPDLAPPGWERKPDWERDELQAVLLCSRETLRAIAVVFPGVLRMPPGAVSARLVLLKQALPALDVSRIVELAPAPLLGMDAAPLTELLAEALARFAEAGLPGPVVAGIVQEDPHLLFEPGLAAGLRELREVWPGDLVDADAWGASDPAELALAIRALARARATKQRRQ